MISRASAQLILEKLKTVTELPHGHANTWWYAVNCIPQFTV